MENGVSLAFQLPCLSGSGQFVRATSKQPKVIYAVRRKFPYKQAMGGQLLLVKWRGHPIWAMLLGLLVDKNLRSEIRCLECQHKSRHRRRRKAPWSSLGRGSFHKQGLLGIPTCRSTAVDISIPVPVPTIPAYTNSSSVPCRSRSMCKSFTVVDLRT